MAFKPDKELMDTPSSGKFKPDIEMYGEPTAGEKAKALAYGAATGLAGSLGELEKFGAYTVPEFFGLREEGKRENKGFGRETLFPTIKEAQQDTASASKTDAKPDDKKDVVDAEFEEVKDDNKKNG